MHGVVDTGSDIIILGDDAFRKVTTVPKLHKKETKRHSTMMASPSVLMAAWSCR